MQVQIIKKVTPNTEHYRLEREEFWIKKFATKLPFGLNTLDQMTGWIRFELV